MNFELEKYIKNILDIYEGDYDLAIELCKDFLNLFEENTFNLIEMQIKKQDGKALAKLAHKLKGAVCNFNMKNLEVYLKELEEMGKQAQFHTGTENIDKIKKEIEKFKVSIDFFELNKVHGK